MEVLPDLREAQHRLRHAVREHIERDQLTDAHIVVDDRLGAEEENGGPDQLADKLHALTSPVAEIGNTEAGPDIARQLLLPAPLHLRLDRKGLQGLNAGNTFNEEGLVLRTAVELLIKAAEDWRHDGRDRDVERE